MRPKSIVRFELLQLASVGVSLVLSAANWEETTRELGPVVVTLVLAVFVFLYVLLILLVSRRRSRIAKWVMVCFTALSGIGLVEILGRGSVSARTIIDVIVILLQVAAVCLLFTPSARAWMRAPRDAKSPHALQQTFE